MNNVVNIFDEYLLHYFFRYIIKIDIFNVIEQIIKTRKTS